VTGGGFQSTAEALYLKKKLLVIPMFDQYEQKCNAAALQEMGVDILRRVGPDFSQIIEAWIARECAIEYHEYASDTGMVAEKILQVAKGLCF